MTSPSVDSPTFASNLSNVLDAHRRIVRWVHRTPVMTSSTMDHLAGRQLFFKCETFQRGGAFKFRGACNAVLKLGDEAAARGVVTHSSGNHAQALALAARLRGIPATVVMPSTASAVKRAAVLGYGASVVSCDPTMEAREQTAARVVAETGGTLIPPYDHPDVISGQGTIGLELLEQVPELDAILAPVGGGGLVSGIALAVRELSPATKMLAAEPEGAADAARSKRDGQLRPPSSPSSIADGLLAGLGTLTWPVVRDVVEQVITVSEPAIVHAMRLVFERMKLVIEPSAAVAVAAALEGTMRELPYARVAVVLSGGNVDLERLPWRESGASA